VHHPATALMRPTPAPRGDQISSQPQPSQGRLNPLPGLTSSFLQITYKPFQVLLISLFKVPCTSQSWSGVCTSLAVIFSLSWSLPAALGCTLKQPDSSMPRLARPLRYRYGPTTRYGKEPLSEGLAEHSDREAPRHSRSTSLPQDREGTLRWAFPFSLAVTQGIPFGFFSSALILSL